MKPSGGQFCFFDFQKCDFLLSLVLLCCLQPGLCITGFRVKNDPISFPRASGVVAVPRRGRDRAAAVPGVDGRWQEELVKGKGRSEPLSSPAGCWHQQHQISSLSLTGNSYGAAGTNSWANPPKLVLNSSF